MTSQTCEEAPEWAASVLAGTGQPASAPVAIVVVPPVIVAVPLPTVVAPMATVAVPMGTVLGAQRQQGPPSGLRRLVRRPRTITATNAATIPIRRASSLTRKAPI